KGQRISGNRPIIIQALPSGYRETPASLVRHAGYEGFERLRSVSPGMPRCARAVLRKRRTRSPELRRVKFCASAARSAIYSEMRHGGERGLMRRRTFHFSCFLAYLGLVTAGFAQQGHPLTGTWSGDWGSSPTQRNQVTFVMN